jgi:pimeloyl-ACP methyl ester carboxylesterase
MSASRRGTGEPLLLITGFAISSAVFEPVLDLYAERFECIVYEHRGGLVTSMPQMAAEAAGVLRELGLDSAHVLGVSMGGMVAQELALRFPERVRGLILAATTPGGPRALRPAPGDLARGRWLFSPAFRREHPERVRELLRSFELRPALLWAHWWATVYHDTVSRLGAIQAPTLVLHGEADALSPVGNGRLLADRIPDARLEILPGGGHAFPLEQPRATFELVAGFVDRPIPAGRARTGVTARAEPLTRAFGLPIGAVRTGASLAGLAVEKVFSRSADVATDR